MNYYSSPVVQPTILGQDKQGYYPGYPAQGFQPTGITPGSVGQPSVGMPSIGQHPSATFGQPGQPYAMASPYTGAPTYSALSSAAYGTSMPVSLPGHSPQQFQGLPAPHPGAVPSSMATHISTANSLPYQQTASYSQPTYLATPMMTTPEQSAYNAQFSSPMYPSTSLYSGYPGVQMQPARPSYPNLGYSGGLPSTRGLNPSYPGAMGFVPRYPINRG